MTHVFFHDRILDCPICGYKMCSDEIYKHLWKHRKEGYCLICYSKPCKCMTPRQALEMFPELRELPCVKCFHFWQVMSDGRESKLYVWNGKLVMVQACGLVPDYYIIESAKQCEMFEPLEKYY